METIQATQPFVHCEHNVNRGDEIQVSEQLAKELEAAGLAARVKAAPTSQNKMAAEPRNKAVRAK